jgi:hypothetical protein
MAARDSVDMPDAVGAAQFATTRWSLVAAAENGIRKTAFGVIQRYFWPHDLRPRRNEKGIEVGERDRVSQLQWLDATFHPRQVTGEVPSGKTAGNTLLPLGIAEQRGLG